MPFSMPDEAKDWTTEDQMEWARKKALGFAGAKKLAPAHKFAGQYGQYGGEPAQKFDYLQSLRDMYSEEGMQDIRQGLYSTADAAAAQASRQARERDIASGRAGSGYAGAQQGAVGAGLAQAKVQADAQVEQMRTQGLALIGQMEQAERQLAMEGMSMFTATIKLLEDMGEIHDEDFPIVSAIWGDMISAASSGDPAAYEKATAALFAIGGDTPSTGVGDLFF